MQDDGDALDLTDEVHVEAAPTRSLLDRIQRGELRVALSFAGQGNVWLHELRALYRTQPARTLIDAGLERLDAVRGRREVQWSGLYPHGFDARRWITTDEAPPIAALHAAPLSIPMIFATQVAHYAKVYAEGLGAGFASGAVVAATGHSQGVFSAALVADAPQGHIDPQRFAAFFECMIWQGLFIQACTGLPARSPMVSYRDFPPEELQAEVAIFNKTLRPDARLHVSLQNGFRRLVVCGPPDSQDRLRAWLTERAEAQRAARRAGQHGGRAPGFAVEDLPPTVPFHSPYLVEGLERMRAKTAELGFAIDAKGLCIDVIDPADGRRINDAPDALERLSVSQFLDPVLWPTAATALAKCGDGIDVVLDFGPQDLVAKLTMSALRGRGIGVLPLSDPAAAARLRQPGLPPSMDYSRYAPRLARMPDGSVVVDNRYSRATGSPPVVLPGMTPTTVDTAIVAAAANAGHTAELAGGGQVTERMLRLRAEELAEQLEPGRGAVFNAMYLDAYLWRLHVSEQALVPRLARQGVPLHGVTISAGIPPLDEAAALLDELEASGLWLNAFKPGTPDQVKQVLKIAAARPTRPLFIHLEGGKAGGHHSWEDLDELLLATYHFIRARDNAVLCVGGGIADEARATALLTGSWARAHGRVDMPVDAVLLGTVAMATAEATTSPSVKRALAAAAGTRDWVHGGTSKGSVTSGRSHLNADIHYLDNAAARAGRLLDSVAGDPDAVEAQRDAIVAALNATAKPWFGDLDAMTWAEVLHRALDLLAVGRGGRYEDGPWLDVSYRTRFADLLRRAEARLCPSDEGRVPSVLLDLAELDEPRAVLARVLDAYPHATSAKLHPLDSRWFVQELCARPGKPVPFVPVIDADVRRWYKSDSLWQAHDDRFTADQVLVIPGPEAVAGIRGVDEPVASLLGRFTQALVDELAQGGARPVERERLPPLSPGGVPAALRVQRGKGARTVTCTDDCDWFATLASIRGPVGAAFGIRRVAQGPRSVPNPLRALCAGVTGARLDLRIDNDGRCRTATYTRAEEHVDIASDGETVRVEVHPTLAAGARALWAQQYRWRDGALVADAADAELCAFVQRALFDTELEPVPLFAEARDTVTVDAEQVAGYAALTGAEAGSVPVPMAFSLGWRTLVRALSCPELRGGLLALVHQDSRFAPGPAWPLHGGDKVEVGARVTLVEAAGEGRGVDTLVRITRDGAVAIDVRTRVHIRLPHTGPWRRQERAELDRVVTLDAAGAALLAASPEVALDTPLRTGDRVRFAVQLAEDAPVEGPASFRATGALYRGDAQVGTLELDAADGCTRHPVRALVDQLDPRSEPRSTPRRVRATGAVTAPDDVAAWAWVSGDRNPIHTSAVVAGSAGLSGPIVHGMWTAARAHAFLVTEEAGGEAARIESFAVAFVAPVQPGASLELTATRTGVSRGRLQLEVQAFSAGPDGPQLVLRATAMRVAPRTAYVFPGQGIQQQGMGMDGYQRSPAARAAWEQADAYTRRALGFSVLELVRRNPRMLVVNGVEERHPDGLLYMTQYTQVAMAALAHAQVAELREAGVLVEGGVAAGHSVGEYHALGSYLGIIPLEVVIELLFRRGRAMHHQIPRTAAGESGYRMLVVRPHYAGLDEAGAKELVQSVAHSTRKPLQIVNYNVRDRQYAVTGAGPALAALMETLDGMAQGDRPPYAIVPGIDVPFHSDVLWGGVDEMRAALYQCLPARIDPTAVVGRWIPNLVPLPFSLERDFVEAVHDYTDSPRLGAILHEWEDAAEDTEALTRTLLAELLAHQFASPVRWIETQELLLLPAWAGGMGIAELVEVGVGYQPTLANLARYTQRLLPVPSETEVRNTGADAQALFHRDADAAPAEPEVEVEVEAAPAAAPAQAAPAPAPAAGSAEPVPDAPIPVDEALTTLLALQARVRPEQVRPDESLDELFDGVSSRVNQVLLDISAEFDVGAIDGAQEMPISDLASRVAERCSYTGGGPFLEAQRSAALKRVFGPAAFGRRDVDQHLEGAFGFGPGLRGASLDRIALDARDGSSSRGGDLGALGPVRDRGAAKQALHQVASGLASARGFALPTAAASTTSAAADPAALLALQDELTGPDGVLTRTLHDLAEHLGRPLHPDTPEPEPEPEAADPQLAARTAPRFDPNRHVALTSAWAWAHRDVARLYLDGRAGRVADAELTRQAARLAGFEDDRVRDSARWYATRSEGPLRAAMERIAEGGPVPRLEGAPAELAATLGPPAKVLEGDEAWPMRGRTALVTGASPNSIASWTVRHLLRGGARVVVTTSSFGDERLAFYRQLYAESAGPGAELHIVPFNQASLEDCDALVAWLFERVVEQIAGTPTVTKPEWVPDLLLPFAAIKDLATMDALGTGAEVSLRAMVLAVEKLVGGIAAQLRDRGLGSRCHVVLPLSPNEGKFGGDGVYAETKRALEVLAAKWGTEREAWGRHTSLVLARIGWVRSTSLMEAMDAVAPRLEQRTGVRTWSSTEMGTLIAALCTDGARALAELEPLRVDLSGGLSKLKEFRSVVDGIRAEAEAVVRKARSAADLRARVDAAAGRAPAEPVEVDALPSFGPATLEAPTGEPDGVPLSELIVVVGVGELAACGSARTRFELEVSDELSAAGVLELAWMTGLVQFDPRVGSWVDVESGDKVEEHALAERYREAVHGRVGIRFIEPDTAGFDPDAITVYATTYLERDFSFQVSSRAEAETFRAADPEHTRVHFDAEREVWRVTRTAGAEVRVPRLASIPRRVLGQIPRGFDPARFGIPGEMIQNVDRNTLFNLVATVDAFISAGLEPEELLRWVHPARVANTQGSCLGGLGSLARMHLDLVLGEERQSDMLQEALLNIVGGYVVQSYVGSYGAMNPPVAACATAAVSVELAADKLLTNKADFVVCGGMDDVSREFVQGFADMNATADTAQMVGMGLAPHQMSRANDVRRRGFVQAQGGGAILLTRGDVALRMGLEVHAVLAYAGTYGDGIHTSVPAPGAGPLSAGLGRERAPLARALERLGLTADDIAVVSKHDTSTKANDPNENQLHCDLQEALGRTPGNPLFVISQKTLTGHTLGGAAALQFAGLCQVLRSSIIPPNRNLVSVDPEMEPYATMLFTDQALQSTEPFKAGLLTSLGFGHVSALVCLVHPDAFGARIPHDQRDAWVARVQERREAAARRRAEVWLGSAPHYVKRTDRRFADGGTTEQALLLTPGARLGDGGVFEA